MFTVTKKYQDFPAAHRQPKHDGHCRLIHGHNWSWEITFTAEEPDENGFVIDVGKLEEVRQFLTKHFDHTLLINGDDPEKEQFIKMDKDGLARVVILDNCGMEALAKFVFYHINKLVQPMGRCLQVVNVRCWEDSKNSASYNKR